MSTIKKISLAVLITGYMAAGINHFRIPSFYISIIPGYLPYPQILNILAGAFEIAFSLMLLFPKSRSPAAWGIILMLIAFLPVHINMLHSGTRLGNITVEPVWAWLRVFFQPVLILWAWWHTRD